MLDAEEERLLNVKLSTGDDAVRPGRDRGRSAGHGAEPRRAQGCRRSRHQAGRRIGYLPGRLKWLVADLLGKQGLHVLNKDMTGMTHRDRELLTGDSPMAANNLGLLAADALIEEVRAAG
ncbi:hypothetical protein [Streptomyces sp. FH025]|uniref:hypothetical protein n=1 Tax=Streptomyces sp. FH025 TaxID=2815937 RepID=UPI001A9F1920|nr:hypothetical protein [Streptomyces sp. FH025]MBO1417677.1 hypothetical protein [Streptomyces sp. FH025]